MKITPTHIRFGMYLTVKPWEIVNHDLYCLTHVLLLADAFENFREMCHKNYGLDPAHYYTAPGLSWDAVLKFTGVKLELLIDPDMLLMFEKGIRGCVSMISCRYSKANNKYYGSFMIIPLNLHLSFI